MLEELQPSDYSIASQKPTSGSSAISRRFSTDRRTSLGPEHIRPYQADLFQSKKQKVVDG
jgi:hypothetical protein